MKRLPKIFCLLAVLIIFATFLSTCKPDQPAINITTDNGKIYTRSILELEFVAYIPLADPGDIETLMRDVNRWIKENHDKYEIISVDVINATVERPASDSARTMPSGAMIVYRPK